MSELQDLYAQIVACTACELHQGRVKGVPGQGPEKAHIMIVGQGPGKAETEQGRPFVGPSGQYLDELLKFAGLNRRDVYLCNIVCCPASEEPQPGQVAACRPFLQKQIALIKPKIIITLGQVALLPPFAPNEKIGQVHGRLRAGASYVVLAMFNPAAALHSPEKYKAAIEEDFGKLGQYLAQEEPRFQEPPLGRDGCYGGQFYAPPSVLQTSRVALHDYRRLYQDETESLFPWRLVRSSVTGLPAYLRGRLPTPLTDGQVIGQAQTWLDQPALSGALLGQPEWRRFFPKPPEVTTTHANLRPPLPHRATSSESTRRFHVRHQQWHLDWPVWGGVLTAHMTEKDQRVSCTCGYLPIPPDKPFTPTITADQAKPIAQEAMRLYADKRVRSGGCLLFAEQIIRALFGRQVTWDIAVQLPLFVLPFAGDYHLAYEARLTSPDSIGLWSLWVDAEKGDVLGQPTNLAHTAFYFKSSQDVVARQFTQQALHDNPCDTFMEVEIVLPSGATRSVDWNTQAQSGADFQAAHIAINARRLYDYLVQSCGADATRLDQPPGGPDRLESLVSDSMTTQPFFADGTISFYHKDSQQKIQDPEAHLPIHSPMLDPEVIFHEVTHSLMWLLNRDPFQNEVSAAPFARSVVEGYANYYARSFGESPTGGQGAAGTNWWASAAYRPNEWGNRWAFARPEVKEGQDLLAQPNLYPRYDADDLGTYDVGMIWARALWDIRRLVGAEIADKIALDAYLYAQGWVTSLESVAEGLIEVAGTPAFGTIEWNDVLLPLLGVRGILAQRGIQALAAQDQAILVGADAGLMRSTDGGVNWGGPDLELDAQGKPLSEIVALAAHGDTWYVATESGIWQRAAGAAAWSPVGNWAAAGRPLALTCSANRLYASTGQGVWATELALPNWIKQGDPVERGWGLPLDMATDSAGLNLYAAGLSALLWSPLVNSSGWNRIPLRNDKSDRVMCLVASSATAFVGTANVGVWEWDVSHERFVNKPQLPGLNGLQSAAVLSLAVKSDAPLTLYAGTTQGVFEGKRASSVGAVKWTKVDGLPNDTTVTRIISLDTGLYAGTALHGLFFRSWTSGAWSEVMPVRPLAGHTLPSIGEAASSTLSFTADAADQRSCYLFPFYLAQRKRITINCAPQAEVELWSLRPNTTQLIVSDSNLQKGGFYVIVVRGLLTNSVTVTVSAQ